MWTIWQKMEQFMFNKLINGQKIRCKDYKKCDHLFNSYLHIFYYNGKNIEMSFIVLSFLYYYFWAYVA